jgi:predicted secreted protein
MTEEHPVEGVEGAVPAREARVRLYLVVGVVGLLLIAGISLLLVAGTGGGDGGPSGPGVYTDPGKTIRLQTGDEFSIELESDPSTGFNWVLTEQLKSSVVRMVRVSYRPPDPPVPGTPGTDVWAFRATGPGTAEITLGYVKQSVTPSETAEERTFTVEVK